LAAASFLLGAIAAGIVLIVASVELIDDATDPDWTKLRCHAGWVQAFLARLENAMRDLLSAAGLAPPFAVQLAHNEIQFATWNGRIVPPFAALNTCRSPSASEEDYPASVWQSTPTTSDWTLYPSEPLETPGQVSYSEGSWWPRHAVDGFSFVDRGPTVVPRYPSSQDNPLATAAGRPSVLDAGEWERRMTRAEQGGTPQGSFGNAVDVSLAFIHEPADEMLNWDLDGDRGLGWPTWLHRPGGTPGTVVRE
jgi:hypothetical protein